MSIVSRRQLMGLLGVAAAAIPLRLARAEAGPSGVRARVAPALPHLGASCALLAPLVAGSVLGPWVVEGMSPVWAGAVTVAMRSASGARFFVDVCARDRAPGAPQAPGVTDLYELFLANEGNGRQATDEDRGRAVMGLAEIVRANEHAVQFDGLLTLRQRLQRHPGQVGKAYIPA